MIIVHEGLPTEASEIAKVFEKIFGLQNKIIEGNVSKVLNPLPKFDGYMISNRICQPELSKFLKVPEGKASLLLTGKDLFYSDESRDDDWVFGVNVGNTSVVSNARMKRFDYKEKNSTV